MYSVNSIQNKIADLIDAQGLYTAVTLDSFPAQVEAVVLRRDPSSAKVTTYYDGSAEGVESYTLYARSKNSITALGALETARGALNFPDMELEAGLFIKAEPTTNIHFLQQQETGEFYYAFTFNVSYTWSK